MSLTIVTYPDPILTTPCKPVEEVNDEIRALVAEMRDIIVEKDAVGLAANQVGRSLRLFVVDIWWMNTGNTDNALTFINPSLTLGKGYQKRIEGCLSFPQMSEEIVRADTLRVNALGLDGESFSMDAQGLLAVAIQHEYDHIEGKTFMDRMGSLTRRMFKKKLIVESSKA